MLVLTRKLLEKLYIGDDICVTVVRLEGGQVRLGIDAPREVTVVRAELLDDRPRPKVQTSLPALASPRAAGHASSVRYSPSEAREADSRRRGRFR
jgi:carbon storage regulator